MKQIEVLQTSWMSLRVPTQDFWTLTPMLRVMLGYLKVLDFMEFMIFSCFSFHFKEYIIKQDMNWDSCFAFPSLTWVLSFLVIICTLMVWSCRVTGKGKPRNVLDITCNNTAPATFRIILCLDPIHTIYIFPSTQWKTCIL